MRRIHLIVRGRVQGVYFRQSAKDQADASGLAGWVRNRTDGTVEAVVEGPAEGVAQFLDWCHRGPTHAQVEEVEATELEPAGLVEGFTVRPTS